MRLLVGVDPDRARFELAGDAPGTRHSPLSTCRRRGRRRCRWPARSGRPRRRTAGTPAPGRRSPPGRRVRCWTGRRSRWAGRTQPAASVASSGTPPPISTRPPSSRASVDVARDALAVRLRHQRTHLRLRIVGQADADLLACARPAASTNPPYRTSARTGASRPRSSGQRSRRCPTATPATALSRSASSNTMCGDLPPSSSADRYQPAARDHRRWRGRFRCRR